MARKRRSPYLRRLRLSALPCLLLGFMYAVWGPMEVFVGNAANFRYTYFEALWPLALIGLFSSLALMMVTALLPKRLFRWAMGLAVTLAVLSYAQAQFLNLDLGLLDGEIVDWAQYAQHGKTNAILWLIPLMVVPVALIFIKRSARVCAWIAAVLLAVQVSAFAVVSAQHLLGSANKSEEPVYVFSGEEQYNVSAEGNVIVFLLDYFSNDYIDSMLKQFPDRLDALKDFTYYDNYDPTYIGTFPSVVHMFTGAELDPAVPIDTWFERAWNSDSAAHFYQTLKDKNYKFNFFDSSSTYFGIQHAENYVSNLVKLDTGSYTVRYDRLIDRMLKLSLYRYLPHMFKESVHQSSADFYGVVNMASDNVPTCYNRNAYNNVLKRDGLKKIAGDGNYLTVQFLRGTHPPYNIDENAVWDPSATLEECAAGYMTIVGNYIQELKRLGVYDDATIIITSDHGDKENSMQVIYFIKEPHVTREKMAVSSAPVSHCEFLGTILHNIGDESAPSIYDFKDGDKRERTVMRNYIDEKYPAVRRYHSTAQGTHTVMYCYTYEGDRRALRKQVRRGPTEILPLTESFN